MDAIFTSHAFGKCIIIIVVVVKVIVHEKITYTLHHVTQTIACVICVRVEAEKSYLAKCSTIFMISI